MSIPDRTTVLIVGAGPAGLGTAVSLLHHGFDDFIIVDALPYGRNSSRAPVIHAATMEALDAIGCGDDIMSQGFKSTTFNVGTRTTRLFSPRIASLKGYTRHPYILVIPQSVTERTLEKKLASFGVSVRRPFKAVGLKRNAGDSQLTDVTFEDGRVITTRYVVGADGTHSAVRSAAGIGFSDPTAVEEDENNNLAQMSLADVTFNTTIADNFTLDVALSPKSLFIFVPLPSSFNESLAVEGKAPISERIYRIGCGQPLEAGELPRSPSKEYIQSLIDRFGPHYLASDPAVNPNGPVSIKEVIWSSRFRTRASVADSPFSRLGPGEPTEGGVILLVGDAAHIHSPAGGQGMNLGLRDAIVLGEALAKHIRTAKTEPLSKADEILHEFAATRHARALEVIKLTKVLMSVTGMKRWARMSWWWPFDPTMIRTSMLWLLGCVPFLQKRIAWELSGLSRR